MRTPKSNRPLAAALAVSAALLLEAGGISPYDTGAREPRLFAEGVVSTEGEESNGSFSPEGREYYFAKFNSYTTGPHWWLICVTRFGGGRWSKPEIVSFSGRYLDFAPRISPDGARLYFASSRPVPGKPAHVL